MAGMNLMNAVRPRTDRVSLLEKLMLEVAGQPEQAYEAMVALADEIERQGVSLESVRSIRRTASTVKPMIGMEADFAWNRLPRLERFRNRKREVEWKQEHTDALTAEGKARVAAVLAA